jgi:ATP-dependent RNA helicase RhlE
LSAFRANRIHVLVATDVASRGIDVDDVTHVINYDIPVDAESYIHRIGRTARAGADGAAISMCDPAELPRLEAIEKLQKQSIRINRDHPFHVEPPRQRASESSGRTGTASGARSKKRRNRNRRRAA